MTAMPTGKASGKASLPEGRSVPARPPEEGARRLALWYLDQAAEGVPRLHDGGDGEALHDLRVGLRRLRSCLKAFDEQLGGSLPRKLRRQLRELAQATGPGRDAEVQLAWLHKQERHLARHERAGQRWLAGRLEARRSQAYGRLRSELASDFTHLEEGLRRRLSVYRTEVHLGGGSGANFGDTAADLLAEHRRELARRFAKVEGPGDAEAAHAARIAAKQLRYLADPMVQAMLPPAGEPKEAAGAREATPATPAIDAGEPAEPRDAGAGWRDLLPNLKELQELLGELHDAHVLEEELAAAMAEAAAERASRLLSLVLDAAPAGAHPADAAHAADIAALAARRRAEGRRPHEAGVLAIARRNRARRDALWADIVASWPPQRMEALGEAVEDLAQALRAAAHPQPEAAAAP